MAADLLGTTLGQYELRELWSEDNTVLTLYNAYQTPLRRNVALLTLRPEHRMNPLYREALTNGAQITAAYEHANIVPVLDYGMENDIIYVVTRLMRGGSLRQRRRQRPLDFQEMGTVVRQIASALDYVHSLGQVHGDPSSGNIVFDSSGSAYLADFIFAGFMVEKRQGIWGTALYMSPERWEENSATPATDQYALAAIAYETLTGTSLFEAPSIVALGVKHMTETPKRPQTYRPEIPAAVNEVLFRALAKKPEDRYLTIADFAREFERALQGTPQHLFISYSRRDKTYAQSLQTHLKSGGFQIWIDDAIEHGDQWFNEIHEAIKSCAAFLVLMTPDAEQSEWVQKEILLAKRYKKPIFPLLLDGDEFAILIDIQFADVRSGELPGTDFHRRVSRAVYGVG